MGNKIISVPAETLHYNGYVIHIYTYDPTRNKHESRKVEIWYDNNKVLEMYAGVSLDDDHKDIIDCCRIIIDTVIKFRERQRKS
jgi:hypothetical protein